MDFGKAFSYVFEDPKWTMKVLIGGIVGIIPIVNFALIGYMLTTMKNVADGQATPMPEWGEFGAHFMKGLYAFVGILVYFVPVILIICCVSILGVAGTAALGSVSGSGGGDSAGAMGTALGAVMFCLQCVAYLLEFVIGVTLYAPLTRFAMSANQLSIFWDFRGNLDFIRKNLSGYIMALLVSLVAFIVAGFGFILCIIPGFFTTFWAYMVAAYLWAQFWRTAQSQGTAPAAPA